MIDRRTVLMGALGLALGIALSFIGFADWSEVHAMFTFSNLRLLFTFGSAVALTMIGLAVFARGRAAGSRPLHRGVIPGAILFGVGWAIAGACPGACLTMIGEGQLAALIPLVGIILGARFHAFARERWFRWDHGSCDA